MRKFCLAGLILLLSMLASAIPAFGAAITLDSFLTSQGTVVWPDGGTNATIGGVTWSTTTPAHNSASVPGALGGTRVISAHMTSGQTSEMLAATTGTGSFSFNPGDSVRGVARVTYNASTTDLPSLSGDVFNPPTVFGIDGGVGRDLTPGNEFIVLRARADNSGLPIIVTFYNAADRYASFTWNIGGSLAFQEIYIPFTAFTATGLTGAETNLDIFRAVTAYTLTIDSRATTSPTDVTVTAFFADAAPEPGSLLLLGVGLIGLGVAHRLRRR